MSRFHPRLPSLCLGFLLLGTVTQLVGCGGSSSADPVNQEPPRDRTEGLRRIQEANIKHDQNVPPKNRSGATRPNR